MLALIPRQKPAGGGGELGFRPTEWSLAGTQPLQPQLIQKPVKVTVSTACLLFVPFLTKVEISTARGIYGWRNSSYRHFICAAIRRSAADSLVKYCRGAMSWKSSREAAVRASCLPATRPAGSRQPLKGQKMFITYCSSRFFMGLFSKPNEGKRVLYWVGSDDLRLFIFFKWADLFKEKKKKSIWKTQTNFRWQV